MAPRAFITGLTGTTISPDERVVRAGRRARGASSCSSATSPTPRRCARSPTNSARSAGATRRSWSTRRAGGCSASARRTGRPIRPARSIARLYERDPSLGLRAAKLGARLIAADLAAVGITVDCLPLADVPVAGADRVIGDRAYGDTPGQVSAIAAAVTEGLMSGGVLPVLKHLPGSRPRHRRQPRAAAGGRRRPRDARSDRFRRVPAARRTAARHDRPCRIHSHRSRPSGDHLCGYDSRSDSDLHRIRLER